MIHSAVVIPNLIGNRNAIGFRIPTCVRMTKGNYGLENTKRS
jgi:hypothetical protein